MWSPLKSWTPGQGSTPELTLSSVVPERTPRSTALLRKARRPPRPPRISRTSPVLSLRASRAGKPTSGPGSSCLPDTPTTQVERYPTVYWTHGFGGNLTYSKLSGESLFNRMAEGKMPPMIWVMLDESLATGTHEFADSVNNGPWGTALTTEFIPYLESKYRMDAKASGRFLQGHSSGGWATLQLQVNYPKIFGGTWSTSPDPSDFHASLTIDLYAAARQCLPSGSRRQRRVRSSAITTR